MVLAGNALSAEDERLIGRGKRTTPSSDLISHADRSKTKKSAALGGTIGDVVQWVVRSLGPRTYVVDLERDDIGHFGGSAALLALVRSATCDRAICDRRRFPGLVGTQGFGAGDLHSIPSLIEARTRNPTCQSARTGRGTRRGTELRDSPRRPNGNNRSSLHPSNVKRALGVVAPTAIEIAGFGRDADMAVNNEYRFAVSSCMAGRKIDIPHAVRKLLRRTVAEVSLRMTYERSRRAGGGARAIPIWSSEIVAVAALPD